MSWRDLQRTTGPHGEVVLQQLETVVPIFGGHGWPFARRRWRVVRRHGHHVQQVLIDTRDRAAAEAALRGVDEPGAAERNSS